MNAIEDVQADMEQLSDEAFETLMGGAPPAGSASADDLIGAQAADDDPPAKSKVKPAKPQPKEEDDEEDEEEDEEGKPKAKKTPKVKEREVGKDIDAATDGEGEDNAEPADDSTSSFLKAKYEGLVERGVWAELDGIEDDFEWTEENYGKIAILQANHKAEEVFEQMVDQTGKYGKQIFDYVKNGGDPEDLIEQFREAKRIESFDISTDEGRQKLVREYYTKILGWSDSRTTKQIKLLADTNGLEEEAAEDKVLMEKHVEKEVDQLKRQQEEYKIQMQEAQKRFASNITTELKARTDMADDEKKAITSSLLVYDQPLPDGRKVNKFTLAFMKLQADPKEYIDLVRYVENPSKYREKIGKKKETEVAKKTWDLVKNNGSLTKTAGSSHAKLEKSDSKDLVVNWKDYIS